MQVGVAAANLASEHAGALALLLAYPALLGTSSYVVNSGLRRAGRDPATIDEAVRDTGTVVGKVENVLVLSLIFAGAYTALAIVFGAKSLVRIEDTESEDSTYYLTGTLVNFTWSVVVGLAARAVAAGVA
jgi:hypothetical protein